MKGLNPSRPVEGCPTSAAGDLRPPTLAAIMRRGFSLIEVLVVVSLLSLIVLVLMTVFNSTQAAFRAGVTQTDVLEGSRSAMELIVSDLKLMSPSDGPITNYLSPLGFYDINFFAGLNNNTRIIICH